MIFLKTYSTISHQPTFQEENCWNIMKPLAMDTSLMAPDYKTLISPAALRRMSPVLKMAVVAAKTCQQRVESPFDAIIIGTALGCLTDTEKFLVTIHASTSGVYSPTAFIQSTHNTIAGQISLELKNHSYNMTHTQNSLSFEVALADAVLCIKDDHKKNVLVGAADEAISFLENLQPELIPNQFPLTSGASVFVLQNENSSDGIELTDTEVWFDTENNTDEIINRFLTKNGCSSSDIELVLFAGEAPSGFKNLKNYVEYCGFFYSASAFAFHLAADFLNNREQGLVLVVNELIKGKLGLTLLKK